VTPDPRVPEFLARILDGDDWPVGTGFQVIPNILVTAWHVLAEIGAGAIGSSVEVDPLGGGESISANVVAVNAIYDLAVLSTESPLGACVSGLVDSDSVPMTTDVVVTGVAEVNDHGRQYRYLDVSGQWQGGTTTNELIKLGSLDAKRVVPGMSGAPVRRLGDDVIVGMVSARYNSVDGWLRDCIWVIRTETLLSLCPEAYTLRRFGLPAELRTELQLLADLAGEGILLTEAAVRIQYERYMEFTRRPSRWPGERDA
jgi:hypothetical protein